MNWSDDTFRGDAPFSEPEIQNIRELISSRQVTNLITNHTYSNLVLRPPGVADFGFPLEEPAYKALGASLAAHNGYSNDPGFGLYDTTGATEDWSFWSTGGFAFTFEIGPDEFHPPYAQGRGGRVPRPGPRGGRRQGRQPGGVLHDAPGHRQHRAPLGDRGRGAGRFHAADLEDVPDVDLARVAGRLRHRHRRPRQFTDTLTSEMKTTGPTFAWHVNPSTRPVVAGRDGRDPTGPPQAGITFANPAGIPAENVDYPPDRRSRRSPSR